MRIVFTQLTVLRHVCVAASLCLVLATAGCATTRNGTRDAGELPSGEMRDFAPAHLTSGLQFIDGHYPALFSGASTAFWLQPGAPLPDAEAEEAISLFGAQFLVFRVELESVFADMGIAYDAVGLRGVQVYLLTPENQRVMPVQTIVGTKLIEEPRGALRSFRRANYLLFPRSAARLFVPWTGTPLGAMRLVVEGFDSMFQFQWAAATPVHLPPAPASELPGVESMRQGVRSTGERARDVLSNFH